MGARYALAIAMVAVALAGAGPMACGSRADRSKEDLIVRPRSAPGALAKGPALFLEARAKGETVSLTLTNYLDVPVVVGPRCFAVIPRGKRQVVPFESTQGFARLPIKSLSKGDSVSGYLSLPGHGDLVGAKLVFKPIEESLRPVACVIQPEP